MVTEKEMAERFFDFSKENSGASYRVTAEEMRRFEKNKELPLMVYKKINNFVKENNIKPKYEGLEEICQISATSLKKSVAGTQKITRHFLYKFTVGLHMNLDEANGFFDLCGGALREEDFEDYICMRALTDGDDIEDFIDEFNSYANKFDPLRNPKKETGKLKKLFE